MNMSIKFNGQEIGVQSMDLTIEREDDPFLDYFDFASPRLHTFTAKLKINPDFNLYETLGIERKIIVTMASDKHMEAWRHLSTKIDLGYKDTKWRIYRRNYRLHRVYLKEVIAK